MSKPAVSPAAAHDDERPGGVAPTASEFERLLAAMAARFINLPRTDVDDAVDEGLRPIGQVLALDRVTLWQRDESGDFGCASQWASPGTTRRTACLSAHRELAWTLGRLRTGEPVVVPSVADLPDVTDRAHYQRAGTRSLAAVPVPGRERLDGAMLFESLRGERAWDPRTVARLRMAATVFAGVLARRRRDDVLVQALTETEALRDRLRAENAYLRREARRAGRGEALVAHSLVMRQLLAHVDQVAATNAPVLLTGETGTGKALIATCIHEASPRGERGMVRVHCAAMSPALVERELFDGEQGVGARAGSRSIGRLELAHGSTIFLDEVADLSAAAQRRLLHVLEDHHIRPPGRSRPIPVDVRVIAATHRDVERLVADGTFNKQLYARLDACRLRVPPLRERLEDLPALVWHFVEAFSRDFGRRIETLGADTMEGLEGHPWPGNVRELRNLVERAMISATSPRLTFTLPPARETGGPRSARLVDIERQHIASVLELTGWRIRGAHGAAVRLGLKPTTLETRMAKLGLSRPRATRSLSPGIGLRSNW